MFFQISIFLYLCRRLRRSEVAVGHRVAHLHPVPVEVVAVVGVLAQKPLAFFIGPAPAVQARTIRTTVLDDGGAQRVRQRLLPGLERVILVRVDLRERVPVGPIFVIFGVTVLVGPAPAARLPTSLAAVGLTGPRWRVRIASRARHYHGAGLGLAGVRHVAVRGP